MNFDIFKSLEKSLRKPEVKNFIDKFINELSDYLQNLKEKPSNLGKRKEDSTIEILENTNKVTENQKIENCIYQVVDFCSDGVYLNNTRNNKIFKETDISQELKDKIGNDYILRYKNGEYVYEEEMTDDFFNQMVDVNEYKKGSN